MRTGVFLYGSVIELVAVAIMLLYYKMKKAGDNPMLMKFVTVAAFPAVFGGWMISKSLGWAR